MRQNMPVPKAGSFGLMGILNVTPDSFYEHFEQPAQAIDHASKLLCAGADVIDLGAESTRPNAARVDWQEECRRLRPCLGAIRQRYPEAVISVDTRNAGTAAMALQAGCDIINDVSGCRHDPALLDVLIQFRPGYVLMHSQGTPENMQRDPAYADVVAEVRDFLEQTLNMLVRAGVPEDRIVLDPGIGFGKTLAHNLELLRHIDSFLQFGRPVLAGVSMKSMFGSLAGLAENERGEATAVTSALLFAKGVTWHRVHEVARVRSALLLAQALQI